MRFVHAFCSEHTDGPAASGEGAAPAAAPALGAAPAHARPQLGAQRRAPRSRQE